MLFRISSFIIYFFSFLFNKLYFKIFKILRIYFVLPKLYSNYSIKRKLSYLGFLLIACILIFCKIFFFIYYYILIFYKILVLKIKRNNFLYSVFWVYWYNLLLHLKVLNIKFQKPVELDLDYYTLKWISYYYYYYIIYILKDLSNLVIWIINLPWYIYYLQIIYYLKLKKLECIYYYQLFTKGFLGIYCFSGILSFIKKIKNPATWNIFKPKKKKKTGSLLSRVKFKYHRNSRIIRETFYSSVKQPMYLFSYSMNNLIESVFFFFFKMGANSIVYYFYKIIKYIYSICVYLWAYIWKTDIIYKFFKLIQRKRW